MNNGVAIIFVVIFVVVGLIALVLVKELRMHNYWRRLVDNNDVAAIRAILEGEMTAWRTNRPPKEISAGVWAGVQRMELLVATNAYVHVSTAAEAELRMLDGQQTPVTSALETGFATACRVMEMIFYDVPNYRPEKIRVDVFTTFQDRAGTATAEPILCVVADRRAAMNVDWNEEPRQIISNFDALFDSIPGGAARSVVLPPEDPLADDLSVVEGVAAIGPDSGSGRGPEDGGVD